MTGKPLLGSAGDAGRQAVIGYSVDYGLHLVRASYWDARGNWVEPLYPSDDIIVAEATTRDRRILGVSEGDLVLHVYRNHAHLLEIYSSDKASFHPLPTEALDWSDEMDDEEMRTTARLRYDPDELTS